MPEDFNKQRHETTGGQTDDRPVDVVAQLLRSAGRRSAPPDEIYQRVLADASSAWQQKLAGRRRQRYRWAAAAAAAAVLAGWMFSNTLTVSAPAAMVVRSSGDIEINADGQSWRGLEQRADGAALELNAGSRIRSRDGAHFVLRLAGEVEVRADADSDLSINDSGRLRLHRGRVYVDTGDDQGLETRIVIASDAGLVRDVGTRFDVQYRDRSLRLRVRDGRIELSRDSGFETVPSGQQLSVSAGGDLVRSSFDPFDSYWSWSQTLAAAPETDGQPVMVLLDWVARETGRSLKFRNERSRRQAGTTTLGGSVGHALLPMDALNLMLPTTDFAFSTSQDGVLELWIEDDIAD